MTSSTLCLQEKCEKPFWKEMITLWCPECHKDNYGESVCKKCGFKFTEHICISCGFVWYCPKRRYEPHTLWNHKYCPHCQFHKSREDNLVDNPTSDITFRRVQ